MKRGGILNQQLSAAIAALGHGDGLLVVDAGFPVPSDAWRIDLAVTENLPDLRTVLDLIAAEMIVETVVLAAEVATHNAPLGEWVRNCWPGAAYEPVPHTQMLSEIPSRAKAVVRTGAFDPWGNILLVSGVDVPSWFTRPGVVVPDYYLDRMPTTGAGR
jgi:D-ribose pyranose/furanose isomerase RbsD